MFKMFKIHTAALDLILHEANSESFVVDELPFSVRKTNRLLPLSVDDAPHCVCRRSVLRVSKSTVSLTREGSNVPVFCFSANDVVSAGRWSDLDLDVTTNDGRLVLRCMSREERNRLYFLLQQPDWSIWLSLSPHVWKIILSHLPDVDWLPAILSCSFLYSIGIPSRSFRRERKGNFFRASMGFSHIVFKCYPLEPPAENLGKIHGQISVYPSTVDLEGAANLGYGQVQSQVKDNKACIALLQYFNGAVDMDTKVLAWTVVDPTNNSVKLFGRLEKPLPKLNPFQLLEGVTITCSCPTGNSSYLTVTVTRPQGFDTPQPGYTHILYCMLYNETNQTSIISTQISFSQPAKDKLVGNLYSSTIPPLKKIVLYVASFYAPDYWKHPDCPKAILADPDLSELKKMAFVVPKNIPCAQEFIIDIFLPAWLKNMTACWFALYSDASCGTGTLQRNLGMLNANSFDLDDVNEDGMARYHLKVFFPDIAWVGPSSNVCIGLVEPTSGYMKPLLVSPMISVVQGKGLFGGGGGGGGGGAVNPGLAQRRSLKSLLQSVGKNLGKK